MPSLPFDASTRSLEPKTAGPPRRCKRLWQKCRRAGSRCSPLCTRRMRNNFTINGDKSRTIGAICSAPARSKFFHAGGARAFADVDADKSRTFACDRFSINPPKFGRNARCGRIQSRFICRSAFKLLDDLQSIVDLAEPLPSWREKLPKSSSWWFLIDRYFAQDPLLTTGFVTSKSAGDNACSNAKRWGAICRCPASR